LRRLTNSGASTMEIRTDFKELLELFNKHRVEYLIVGGYALAFHGAPRFTRDIDLFVRPTSDNAVRILAALAEFGFGSLGLSQEDFTTAGRIVQLGVAPIRIDLVTRITGVAWEKADAGKASGFYDDVPVFFLGRDEFIANKRATGRTKDAADVEALGES
jgi:Nucleotidyl transferase AbiEii toxin, Type IV TA system